MKMTEQFTGAELTIIENDDDEKPLTFILKEKGKQPLSISLTQIQCENVTDAIVYGLIGRNKDVR